MTVSKILTVALVVLLATVAWAQPSPEQIEQQAKKRMHEMIERLELTDEQQEQVKPILKGSGEKTRELRDRARGMERTPEARSEMREAMQRIQEDTREQLAGVLTAEQLDEYDAMVKEWRAERRNRRGGGGGGGRGQGF